MITLSKKASSNVKLGHGVYTTYRRVGETCPSSCKALQSGACYALGGNVGIHQKRSAADQSDGSRLREWLGALPKGVKVRHHVSGDLFLGDRPDLDYIADLIAGHKARPDLKGWGYTHGWEDIDPIAVNARGITINASLDTADEIELARDMGWDTTVIVGESQESYVTLSGHRVVICPNQTHDVSCADCMLCFRKDRKVTIGFRVHGSGKSKWSQ